MRKKNKFHSTGCFLKEMRQKNNLTMHQVAEKIKIFPQNVYHFEAGLCFVPKKSLKKIIKLYNLDQSQVSTLINCYHYDQIKMTNEKFKQILS